MVRWKRIAVWGLAGASLACGETARITLLDGAHTPAPVFVIDAPEAPRFITFDRFSGQPWRVDTLTVWLLMRRRDTAVTPPIRITYGTVPSGYVATAPAALLLPANYRVYAKLTHANGERRFRVTTNGTVQ